MKKGRKSLRSLIQPKILEVLLTSKTPLTISSIKKMISSKFNNNYSWNTIQKYLDELVKSNQVLSLHLTSSEKKKLRVYILKK